MIKQVQSFYISNFYIKIINIDTTSIRSNPVYIVLIYFSNFLIQLFYTGTKNNITVKNFIIRLEKERCAEETKFFQECAYRCNELEPIIYCNCIYLLIKLISQLISFFMFLGVIEPTKLNTENQQFA